MLRLQTLLDQTLTQMGYELVEYRCEHSGRLCVFMDKPGGVTIDDCVHVSNHLNRLLLVEEIDYNQLEVSSPGLDRVLNKPSDFVSFAGEQVRVRLRIPLADGRRHVIGQLLSLEEAHIVVKVREGEALRLLLSQVDRVQLEPLVHKPARLQRKKK